MGPSTLPSWIDVTSRQLILSEFSIDNSYSAITFIKNSPDFAPPGLFQALRLLKSRNQVVQLPITPLFQPPHHSKLENVFDFHIKVKIKLLNAWLLTRKNKSFECGIVINCFENIYCQRYIRLNTGVLLIRFNSIE